MRHARAHPRLVAIACALFAGLVVLSVAGARSRGGAGCTAPPPTPDLPAQLRSLGDFDQPYPAGDLRSLDEAAQRAATALHPDLAQYHALADRPIHVAAVAPAQHDAELVVLVGPPSSSGAPYVEGVVAFLDDCAGQHWYHDVADLGREAAPPTAFPSVSAASAASRLGVSRDGVRLVHGGDPLRPLWQDRSTGRTTPAISAPGALPPTPAPSS